MTWPILHGKASFLSSLGFKRIILLFFLLVQLVCAVAYLILERVQIESKVAQSLKNTAVLQTENFNLLRKLVDLQLQNLGREYASAGKISKERLHHEIQAEWLDALFLLDAKGNIVNYASLYPVSDVLPKGMLEENLDFGVSPQYLHTRLCTASTSNFFVANDKLKVINGGGLFFYHSIQDKNGVYKGCALALFGNRTLDGIFNSSRREGLNLGDSGNMTIYNPITQRLLYTSAKNVALKPGDAYQFHQQQGTPYGSTVTKYTSPLDGQWRMANTVPLAGVGDRVLVIAESCHEYLRSWYFQVGFSTVTFLLMAVMQWMLLNFIHRSLAQRDMLAFDALHDPLTGLANRRRFDGWSSEAVSASRRYMQPLTLLALDLDFFKRINDEYGHDGGDAVLLGVAKTLRSELRECDLPARFGGEEFIVALPQTPLAEALLVAERIRSAIQASKIHLAGQTLHCTVSIGVSQVAGQAVEAALKEADKALYKAKKAGRNCVITLGHDDEIIANAESVGQDERASTPCDSSCEPALPQTSETI